MAQKTNSQLTTEAEVIQNETVMGANTASRVGEMFVDIIDSKINNDKIDTSTSLGTSNTRVPSQNAVKTYVDNNVGLPYNSYVAIISQNGTNPITQNYILYNDFISPITFSYQSTGIYTINCADFTNFKTVAFFQQGTGATGCTFQLSCTTGQVTLIASDNNNSYQNGLFNYSQIEIRVYP